MVRSVFGKLMWVGRATPVGAATVVAAALLWVVVALLVLGPSAHQASAAAKPDLVVSQLSNPPSPLEPGQKFRATSTTKNAGQARAAASTTRFYLSGDRLKGTGDVRFAAGQPVGTLGVGDSARSTTTLTVPAATKPERSYYLIACADDPKKVGESREANNCRASAERTLVTENPFKTAPEFDFTPDPLAVTPTLEKSSAVTKKMTTIMEGDTLTTTATDGTKYTLALPKDALLTDEKITMTPVSKVEGLPMSGGLAAGVDLKPDGLQLHKPARLTITPPQGAEVPLSRQTGLSWHGGGEEFHLYALKGTEQLAFELSHFSAYGVGSATDAERAAAMERMPTRTADQYRQATSELLREEREAQLNGEPGDPKLDEKLADFLAGYYRDVVRPKMLAAETDDTLAESAIQEGLGWARQVELLGLSEDPFFAQKQAEVMDSVIKILQNAFDKAFERCVTENDPSQAVRLLALQRMAQLLGVSFGDAFDKLNRCVRFELDFEMSATEDYDLAGIGEDSYLATAKLRVEGLPLTLAYTNWGLGLWGEKNHRYTSWNIDGTGACWDYTPTGTEVHSPFRVDGLPIQFNFLERMGPDGRTVRTIYPPDIAMYVSGGSTSELSTRSNIPSEDCGETPISDPSWHHAVYQLTWHQMYDEFSGVIDNPIRKWNFLGGSTWATTSHSIPLQPSGTSSDTKVGGQAKYTLYHVPQP